MLQPADQNTDDLIQRLKSVLKEQRAVTRLIRERDENASNSGNKLADQRRAAWASLRGSVIYRGDIVAPIDVKWDADA